jgi:hypothetical protein
MTKPEKFLGIITVVSVVLKFRLVPYGGLLLVLSLATLAFYYYQFGKAIFNDIALKNSLKKDSYKEIQNSMVVLSKVAGIGLSLICIGAMFRLNHWAYSSMILIVGLGTTLLVSIVALIGWMKSKNETYIRILKRSVIIGGFGLMVVLVPDLTFNDIVMKSTI